MTTCPSCGATVSTWHGDTIQIDVCTRRCGWYAEMDTDGRPLPDITIRDMVGRAAIRQARDPAIHLELAAGRYDLDDDPGPVIGSALLTIAGLTHGAQLPRTEVE